jgi:glycosyltransferase involved in cell wall biosynthesis
MSGTIFQLISSEGVYGAEQMVINLAEGFNAEGLRCMIGVFEDRRNPQIEVANAARRRGIDVELIPCSGRIDFDAISKIKRLLDDHSVDVLHAHGYKADIYARLATIGRSQVLISTCHNWPDPRPLMRFYAGADRLALRTFDGIAAVSHEVAGQLRRWGVPDLRVQVIRNGISVQASPVVAPADLRGPGDGLVVGYVGRLIPGKGVLDLLQAAQLVLSRFPRTRFVFVGDGPLRMECEANAAQRGIADSVSFCGHRSDIKSCYAAFDLLVLPSHNEGLPMCILEGMAAGLPVVATRVGSIPEVVLDQETGLLVQPGSPQILADAIGSMLGDYEWASRLGESGRERVAQHYSVRSMVSAYVELYREARSSRGRRILTAPANS